MQRDDGSWLIDGLIPVPELKDRLDLKELPEEDRGRYNTLAGMIMLLLGRLPRTADAVDWEGWRFEVVDLDGKRVDKVLVARTGESERRTRMIAGSLHRLLQWRFEPAVPAPDQAAAAPAPAPSWRDSSPALWRSTRATVPSTRTSKIALGPMAVRLSTRWSLTSNTGAAMALMPGTDGVHRDGQAVRAPAPAAPAGRVEAGAALAPATAPPPAAAARCARGR